MILSIFAVMITKEQIKNTGATFTPRELSVFLAERIGYYINSKQSRVLDPACGEAELLVAMGEVLSERGGDFSLTGFDSNKEYLNFAETRLSSFSNKKTDLILGDFLMSVDVTNSKNPPSLFDDMSTSEVNSSFDIVIANPPYVRTQILGTEQAQNLARKFNLKGRVDLYYPFLISMTESLKEGGILGVITSNRYL